MVLRGSSQLRNHSWQYPGNHMGAKDRTRVSCVQVSVVFSHCPPRTVLPHGGHLSGGERRTPAQSQRGLPSCWLLAGSRDQKTPGHWLGRPAWNRWWQLSSGSAPRFRSIRHTPGEAERHSHKTPCPLDLTDSDTTSRGLSPAAPGWCDTDWASVLLAVRRGSKGAGADLSPHTQNRYRGCCALAGHNGGHWHLAGDACLPTSQLRQCQ